VSLHYVKKDGVRSRKKGKARCAHPPKEEGGPSHLRRGKGGS